MRHPAQSHLAHYALHFSCVEINSSFYRPHQGRTYARWRDDTPARFRFCVKFPRAITHEAGLRRTASEVARFYTEIEHLQPKLSAVLVQLPPALEFDAAVARAFFRSLPKLAATRIACEPRHESWFSAAADDMLCRQAVARVAADPARFAGADAPGGDRRFHYHRWHGSPAMYYSKYSEEQLARFAAQIQGAGDGDSWCIFDNTARHAAWNNALDFISLARGATPPVIQRPDAPRP